MKPRSSVYSPSRRQQLTTARPPLASSPEGSRRHFAALRELAAEHDLPELSMGTSQDYVVAVEEGATIIRLGTGLYRSGAS